MTPHTPPPTNNPPSNATPQHLTAAQAAELRANLRPLLQGPAPLYNTRDTCDDLGESTEIGLRAVRKALQDAKDRLQHRAVTPEAAARIQAEIENLRTRAQAILSGRPDPLQNLPPRARPYRIRTDGITHGWMSWSIDAPAIVACAPSLHLQRGWTLCAYAYRHENNGSGLIWSLPPSAPNPPNLYAPNAPLSDLPRPPGCQPFCHALSGDESPASYLWASLLIREVSDFAALWHGIGWGDHRVIDALPPGSRWQCIPGYRPLSDWRPKAHFTNDAHEVVVKFHTVNGLGTWRFFEHTDLYTRGRYTPQSSSRVVATAGPGYVT